MSEMRFVKRFGVYCIEEDPEEYCKELERRAEELWKSYLVLEKFARQKRRKGRLKKIFGRFFKK